MLVCSQANFFIVHFLGEPVVSIMEVRMPTTEPFDFSRKAWASSNTSIEKHTENVHEICLVLVSLLYLITHWSYMVLASQKGLIACMTSHNHPWLGSTSRDTNPQRCKQTGWWFLASKSWGNKIPLASFKKWSWSLFLPLGGWGGSWRVTEVLRHTKFWRASLGRSKIPCIMYTALPGLLPTLSQVELYIQNMVGGSGMVAPPQPCQPHRETSDNH